MIRRNTLASRLAFIATIGLSTFAAACGGSDDPAADTGSSGGGGATASATTGAATSTGQSTSVSSGAGGSTPIGETITLGLEAFDVQPGTERQVCKTINLPGDVAIDIVQLRSTMAGKSHHFNAYKVLTAGATDPVSAADSVVHDCSPAAEQLAGDAAYIFGSSSPERTVDLPAGVAFHFEASQQIILEQHVINTTGEVVQGGVTFDIALAAPGATIEHHADIIWFANWSFFLPANQETSDTTSCTVPYAVELFGLTSHTHGLGAHFSIEKWTQAGNTHLYDSADWQHPPYAEYAPTISLEAGEGLEWTCTWDNTTSQLVVPGKNSTDEMCMTFAYGYPRDSLGADPVQCNK